MKAYLGLGSNVGDRLANLRAARAALDVGEIAVTASSSVYETAPQGEVLDQGDFLNACVAVETELEPEALLDECKRVESELGRAAGGPRHGPRAIDVDLLLVVGREHRSERLNVPHRDILARRFVLVPLIELEPELALPDGTRLSDALPATKGQAVRRVGPLA